MTRTEVSVGKWLEDIASHAQENADNSIEKWGSIGMIAYLYWISSAHLYANLADFATYSPLIVKLEEIESSLQSTEEALTTISPSRITKSFRQIQQKLTHNKQSVEYNSSYSTDFWLHETRDHSLVIWSVYDEGVDRRVTIKFGKSASNRPSLDDESATTGTYFENQTYSEYVLDSTQLWALPLCGPTSAKVYRYSKPSDGSVIPVMETEVEDLNTIDWLTQLKKELPSEISSLLINK